MCGISVIVNKVDKPIEEASIKKMNDLIRHRGPDGDGFYFGQNFAFGHRRLAILDLSPDGAQPMTYEDDYVITFNGEIFNYLELREELISYGYKFYTKTDTEVILAAYSKWGKDCVQRFNGMWSFVLHDKKENSLFCSRDRFGVKPFYLYENQNQIIFASEIKQLLPFQDQLHANHKKVLEYLITGSEECDNETFFKGIWKLEQGHNLVYNLLNHEYTILPYYELVVNQNYKNISEDAAVKLYTKQLEDAVSIRMRSDVEVGTCLSGGLDSSAITSMAATILAQNSTKRIKAFHAKANEKEIDESAFAEEVAITSGSHLQLIEPTYDDFKEMVEEVIKVQEEPFGSPSIFLQYFVLKEARRQNCLVMLDGQGGDETLLGYERYFPAFLLNQKGTNKIKEFINSSNNSQMSKLDLLKFFLYFTNYRLRMRYLKKRNNFIKREFTRNFESSVVRDITRSYSNINSLQILELMRTQLPHLLKYEDKNSMANSVETRLPFLDYRCVELALSLPNEYKIKSGWTKNILRKGVESKLPKSVVWRKNKLGFNAPEQTWLNKHFEEMQLAIGQSAILNKILDKDKFRFKELDLRTQWRLYNIAKWEKSFNVNW